MRDETYNPLVGNAAQNVPTDRAPITWSTKTTVNDYADIAGHAGMLTPLQIWNRWEKPSLPLKTGNY